MYKRSYSYSRYVSNESLIILFLSVSPVGCDGVCVTATAVSVFGFMFILIIFCVIMALYLYRKVCEELCRMY